MIAVACPHCQKNLKVKDDLAGKKIRCPACKQALDVPGLREDATLPPSSPPVHEDATLPPSAAAANGEATVGLTGEASAPVAVSSGQQRYEVEAEIARGGMGAIMRANDRDIEREVAIKYLLNQADATQKARFIEEAKITGQLEHPNIVPIHDLGLDADGQMYFSMKMVKGRSLADILKDLDESKEYTLGRLLTVFSNVCNALAYAHSRQVIHRDLKPANIMIGDFGEVYVMDWGVAKVLTSRERQRPVDKTHIKAKASLTQSGGMVKTNRTQAADMTQDGAIMGTPAYMPPEQAKGEIDAIDQRSDVYSLGAILYEMLTLTPPVGRGGDAMAVLMRVVDGTIDLPAKRAPKRWIPSELSAIAMKALAMAPDDRYQSVEELQRDIQLFQEGRSVSAKQDSAWEVLKKLVKRNKGASAGVGAALLVLLGSLVFIGKAWVQTSKAYGELKQEQEEKRERTRQAVPALVAAARLAVERREFDNALSQLNLALTYDEDNLDARLLKGQLLLSEGRNADGVDELRTYLRLKPGDEDARSLMELCEGRQEHDAASLLNVTRIFTKGNALALADRLLSRHGSSAAEARKNLLEMYRKQIEAGLPGYGPKLTLDNDGRFKFMTTTRDKISTLSPLSGIPLTTVYTYGTHLVDGITPLKGMPLTTLELRQGSIRDLTPLRGMKLTKLVLSSCHEVRDLSPLEGMPLSYLDLSGCNGFSELSPLKDMPITWLNLRSCEIRDLSPLEGMPLTTLDLYGCTKVTDLSPLRGAPILLLNLTACNGLRDLSPLQGMNLSSIVLTKMVLSQLKGMEVLREMQSLRLIGYLSKDFSAEEFWKKYDAGEFNK